MRVFNEDVYCGTTNGAICVLQIKDGRFVKEIPS